VRGVQENYGSHSASLGGIDDPVVSLEFLAVASERVRIVGHEADHAVFGHGIAKTHIENLNSDLFRDHGGVLHEVEALFPDFFYRELRFAHMLVQGGILDLIAKGRPLTAKLLGYKIEPFADRILARFEGQGFQDF
jgi:hypothetical protein